MCKCINLTVISFVCLLQLYAIDAAALTDHYGQRLTHSNAYLPPYGHSNFDEKTHNVQTQTESYEPNYSSYVPPASGAASSQYSRTQATSKIPLSTLLPQSVIEQFATPASAYELQQQYQQQQQQHQQKIPSTGETQTDDGNELSVPVPVPMLMVEKPVTMYLTSGENKTLEAAKLLASTILEAQNSDDAIADDDDNDNDDVSHANERSASPLHGVATSDFNALNRTDIVVVKAHKNAYIIPAPLTRDGTSRMNARELYAKRNQLPKAYTINQFVFIIKPERINFLNKLV